MEKKKLTIWWTGKVSYKSEIEGTEEELNEVIYGITESDTREEQLWEFAGREFEEDFEAELEEYDVQPIKTK